MSRRSIPRGFWEKFYVEHPEYAPGSDDERSSEEEGAEEEQEEQIQEEQKQRGRPKLPNNWTRVINVDLDTAKRVH